MSDPISNASSETSLLSKLLDRVEEDEEELIFSGDLVDVDDLEAGEFGHRVSRGTLDISVSPLSERSSHVDDLSTGFRTPLMLSGEARNPSASLDSVNLGGSLVGSLKRGANAEQVAFLTASAGRSRDALASSSAPTVIEGSKGDSSTSSERVNWLAAASSSNGHGKDDHHSHHSAGGELEEKADSPISPKLTSFKQIQVRHSHDGDRGCACDHHDDSSDESHDSDDDGEHQHGPNCGHLAVLHFDRVQDKRHVGFLVHGEMVCFAPRTADGDILRRELWTTGDGDRPLVVVNKCPIDVVIAGSSAGERSGILQPSAGLLIDVDENLVTDAGNVIHDDHEDVLVHDEQGDLLIRSRDTGKVHGKLLRYSDATHWWSDLFVAEKDAHGLSFPSARNVLVKSVLSVKGVCCKSEVPSVVACCKEIRGVVDANVSILSQQVFLLHEKNRVIPIEASELLTRNHFPSRVIRSGGDDNKDVVSTGPMTSARATVVPSDADLGETVHDNVQLKWNIALALFFWAVSWLEFLTIPEHIARTRTFSWLRNVVGPVDSEGNLSLENFKYFAILSVILAFPQIAWKGFQSVRHRIVDVNVLMSIAVVGALGLRDFFEAATVVVIFSFSDYLSDRASQRARNALKVLMDMKPEMAYDEVLGEISVDQVVVGQSLVVRSGGKIPVDGILTDDACEVDESNLTGESKPVAKRRGDFLSAGTLNVSQINCRMKATALSRDSAVSRMIHLVEESTLLRSPTEQLVDRIARVYTPMMIVAAVGLATVPWLLMGQDGRKWLKVSLTLLVVACPCALVISTPITYVCAIAQAARFGVLIKGGKYLETLAKVNVLCSDKTGTLTRGEFEVDEVLHLEIGGAGEEDDNDSSGRREMAVGDQMMGLLGQIEQHAIHPISKALFNYCKPYFLAQQQNNSLAEIKKLEIIPGAGIKALVRVDGKEDLEVVVVGEKARKAHQRVAETQASSSPIDPSTEMCHPSSPSASSNVIIHQHTDVQQQRLVDSFNARQAGKTVSWLIINGKVILGVAASDQLRPEAFEALKQVRSMGIKVVVLTGDNQGAAMVLKDRLDGLIDEIHFSLKPEDKVAHVRQLKQTLTNVVCVVGDGVNDAPAFSSADLGIAMAYGAPLALETADCALMDNDLRKLPRLFRLARRTRRTIIQNLVFSFVSKFVVLGLTLAGMMTLGLAVATDVGAMLIVTVNGAALIDFRAEKEMRVGKPAEVVQGNNQAASAMYRRLRGDAAGEEENHGGRCKPSHHHHQNGHGNHHRHDDDQDDIDAASLA